MPLYLGSGRVFGSVMQRLLCLTGLRFRQEAKKERPLTTYSFWLYRATTRLANAR